MRLQGRLVELIFCSGTFWAEQDTTVAQVAQLTASGKAKRCSPDFAKKTRNLVFSLKIHLMAWRVAFTTVCGPEPKLRRSEPTCHVFGHGCWQSFRSETSESLSHSHLPMVSVLFVKAVAKHPQSKRQLDQGSCRSDGFPRTRMTKSSCACDGGMEPVSVGTFFFLLLSSFFFCQPESCLEIKFFARKSDVSGRRRELEEEMKKNEKKKRKGNPALLPAIAGSTVIVRTSCVGNEPPLLWNLDASLP